MCTGLLFAISQLLASVYIINVCGFRYTRLYGTLQERIEEIREEVRTRGKESAAKRKELETIETGLREEKANTPDRDKIHSAIESHIEKLEAKVADCKISGKYGMFKKLSKKEVPRKYSASKT